MSHRRVAGSHYKTRLGFTLCLSHTNSALLLDKLQTRTAAQSLGLRIASLHQAHRFSSPCGGLEPQDKSWVYALPLSTWLCVSPRRVAGTHRRARVGSMFCLSPPGSACLLAETQIPTADQGLGPHLASLHQVRPLSSPSHGLAPHNKNWVHVLPLSLGSACVLAKSRDRTVPQSLGPCFASRYQAHHDFSLSREPTPQDKAWVHALHLTTTLTVSHR